MRKTFFLFFTLAFIHLNSHVAKEDRNIDVVIPCTEKDLDTLNLCIEGIKENCDQIRRIIVVSAKKLTDEAEWFEECRYPFSIEDTALAICKGDEEAALTFTNKPRSRLGWYYQQLLKFYAPFVIPDISPNVLILDSDTIFLNPVTFISEDMSALYNFGTEHHIPYFVHGGKLVPDFERVFSHHSGICHHMLFQKDILENLFFFVEETHEMEFWEAFCYFVDVDEWSGASEYEIYFNYIFSYDYPVQLRSLVWKNISNINHIPYYKVAGFHYVSCHSWAR